MIRYIMPIDDDSEYYQDVADEDGVVEEAPKDDIPFAFPECEFSNTAVYQDWELEEF